MRLMKYLFGCLIFGWLLQTAAFADSGSGAAIDWRSYDQAQKESPAPSKKLFVYFYADWCSYCHKMNKETFVDPAVAAFINQNFIPIRVNSDQQKELAARHGVSGLPDLRFLTPQGETIARWPGYIDAKQFLPMLKYIQSDSYLKMGYKEYLKQPS